MILWRMRLERREWRLRCDLNQKSLLTLGIAFDMESVINITNITKL